MEKKFANNEELLVSTAAGKNPLENDDFDEAELTPGDEDSEGEELDEEYDDELTDEEQEEEGDEAA